MQNFFLHLLSIKLEFIVIAAIHLGNWGKTFWYLYNISNILLIKIKI